jgi:proteasome lid subunit RPN8/RPN11
MSNWKLNIGKEVRQQMHKHAEHDYPDECCGFLYGRFNDDGSLKVTEIRPVTNAKTGDKIKRFQIYPNDYRKAEQYAVQQDLDLVGVYHSHPDHPAQPSDHDLKQALPVFSYIIVSVQNGVAKETTSWRIEDSEEFQEEKILETIINS